MATNAETIDSLLVSLGLDVDKKSFQQATDAINDVKNKSLQLLAAAGVGVGFDAWTRGVARYAGEIESLSFATKATTRDVEALRHAFKAQGLAVEEADSALRRMADVQRNIQLGKLPAFPGSDVLIGKTPVQMLQILSGMLPGMDEQMRLRALQEMGIAPGSSTHQMLAGGGFGKKFEAAQAKVTGINPELSEDVAEFNQQMADLQTNFNELSKSMGEKLLPPLNAILKITNDFISANPELVEAGMVIAGILGTLQGFKALKWIFGLGGAAGAGGASATAAAGAGMAARLGKLATRGSLLSLLIPTNDTPGTTEELASIGGVGGGISSGDLEKLSQGWSYDERTGWTPPGGAKQHAQAARLPRVAQYSGLTSAAESRYGLPPGLLSAVMQTESGGNPQAVSGAGAMGLYQLMPGTASDLGLQPGEAFDPEKSTDAAARYLKQLLNRYGGDLPTALAAYNWGMGNVEKKGLGAAPRETREYVPKVLGSMGADDALSFAQGAYSSPSDSLPGSSYSPTAQAFEQTNHIIIQSTGNPVQDQKLVQLYTRNWGDSLKSDIY